MLRDVPQSVQHGILSVAGLSEEKLLDFSFSSGGCINHGGKLTTAIGDVFIKWNDALRFPLMFEAEAKGLILMKETNTVRVPDVIGYGQDANYQFLLLEYIDQQTRGRKYWSLLGSSLASLHRIRDKQCGLDYDNYIGSIPQFNGQQRSWVNFFIEQRLQKQLERAINSGLADRSDIKKFDILFNKLTSLLPQEDTSLLHGDLWSGNVIVTKTGEPCLIDPAVYFGHREVDLAMTRLFGSFSADFYSAYHENFPLLPGHEQRVDLYNLYPLLVHLNLFGSSYYSSISSILARYI